MRADFSLGGEQAEADPLLKAAFYESGHYRAVASPADPRCFLVGRTGSGKSAVLQMLAENEAEHVIRINPEDLSLPYITDLGVIRFLSDQGVHLDPLFIALWKHIFLVEIIRQRYSIDSVVAKHNFLTGLRDKISRNKSKQAALDYFNEFEGKFWCETDERVRDITNAFEKKLEVAGGVDFRKGTFTAKRGENSSESSLLRIEEIDRFQRIVNETQLPRLNQMMAVLDEDVLDSEQNFTYVLIDDLDRDWVDEKVANDLIRCLFRAVVDLKRVRNLKVVVALRTNIFEQLNFGARTGGQEEKFRSLTLRMRWNADEIEQLLDARVRSATEAYGANATTLKDLLPHANHARGNPIKFILDRTLLRPRDAIAFVNECIILSGSSRITWDNINAAERQYSHNRLLALRDEWKPTYPGIDVVLAVFEGCNERMSRDDWADRLQSVALLTQDPTFAGNDWITKLAEPIWLGGTSQSWGETYRPLSRLLFSLGFVGFTQSGGRTIYVHDQPDYTERVSDVEAVVAAHVHPAFRAALDVRP